MSNVAGYDPDTRSVDTLKLEDITATTASCERYDESRIYQPVGGVSETVLLFHILDPARAVRDPRHGTGPGMSFELRFNWQRASRFRPERRQYFRSETKRRFIGP